MAWVCEKCGERNESDNLNFPIMHGYKCDGKVVPDNKTVKAWGKVIE